MPDADRRRADHTAGTGELTMHPPHIQLRGQLLAVLFMGAASTMSVTPAAARLLAPGTCRAPEYRQFDFFIGDWDTYDVGTSDVIVARNHVTPMLDGCALREVYEQTDGLRGESFSAYDATRRVWHQSWVTNRGQLLLLDGALDRGHMTLTATERQPDGSASLLRGTWWRDGATVRERAERSRDGGTNWTPVFDIVFRAHRAHPVR